MALRVVDSDWKADDDTLVIEARVVGREGWFVEGRFRAEGAAFVLAELRVLAAPDAVPSGGIQSDLMRRITLSDLHAGLVERGVEYAAVAAGAFSLKPSPAMAAELGRLSYRMGVGARSARNLTADANLARWAHRYVEALASTPRAPIAALAKKHRLDVKQVSNLIEQARSTGMLTRPGKGAARGALTTRAIELLMEADRDNR